MNRSDFIKAVYNQLRTHKVPVHEARLFLVNTCPTCYGLPIDEASDDDGDRDDSDDKMGSCVKKKMDAGMDKAAAEKACSKDEVAAQAAICVKAHQCLRSLVGNLVKDWKRHMQTVLPVESVLRGERNVMGVFMSVFKVTMDLTEKRADGHAPRLTLIVDDR